MLYPTAASASDIRPADPPTVLALATTTVAPSVTSGTVVVVATAIVVVTPESNVVVG